MAVQINVAANQAALVQSIQAGVQAYNQRFANQNQVNLQVNARAFSQPLGRITGDVKDFEAALAASNARVIAFGASTAILGGVLRGFRSIAEVTVEVEKNLADINRVFGLTTKELQKFSTDLFNVSKQTASSFGDASKAALEFSRQGVKAEEVLQRTADAMTLARLAGMNVNNAIEALTATVNGFQATGITTTQVLNKLVAVEQSYAVSAGDLAEALSRTGLAAQEAGVNIDQLNALVTAAQEKTARGGAVIGNALKTIFTRLQRTETLDQLEAFNIGVRDIQGNILPAVQILQNFASAYNTLADSQRSQLSEQVAGVYQVNILKAIISDLNNKQGAYAGALQKGATATNEAQVAAAKLNQTLDALLSQTSTVAQQFANNVGKVTFEPLAKYTAESFKSLFENLNEILEGEGVGSTFANGLLKGIRNVLAGPGAIGAFFVLFKLIQNSFTYLSQALPQIVGITTETQNRKNIEQAILQIMQQQGPVAQALAGQMGNQTAQAQLLLQLARQQTAEYQRQQALVAALAPALSAQGVSARGQQGLRVTRSGGYIPKEAKLQETIGALAGGYTPGQVIKSPVGGVMNSAEQVKYMPGFAQPFINPPANSDAGRTHRRNSINKTGVDPYMNNGFIPNFYISSTDKKRVQSAKIIEGNLFEKELYTKLDTGTEPPGSTLDFPTGKLESVRSKNRQTTLSVGIDDQTLYGDAKLSLNSSNITSMISKYIRAGNKFIIGDTVFDDKNYSILYKYGPPDNLLTNKTRKLSSLLKHNPSLIHNIGHRLIDMRTGNRLNKAGENTKIGLTFFGDKVDIGQTSASGFIPNLASSQLPVEYRNPITGKLNNPKIAAAIRMGKLDPAVAMAAGYKTSSQSIQERKQGVLERVLSSGFKRIGISGIGTLPSNTTFSKTNPFAKNFESLALKKAQQMFGSNNIVFASNYEKGGRKFKGAPTNTAIDALEDNLTGPVIEMKSGDTTPDAALRKKFTQGKNELIEMWHNAMPDKKIDSIVQSIGARPEYLFYNADKEVKRGTEQILQANKGFIPNFAADYINQVMNLESNMSGNKAVLDTQSGPFPFIRNSSQPNFAAAISDHGGMSKALNDSYKNQVAAGLMNKGFVPNFAPFDITGTSLQRSGGGAVSHQKINKAINDYINSINLSTTSNKDISDALTKLLPQFNLNQQSFNEVRRAAIDYAKAQKAAAQQTQQQTQQASQGKGGLFPTFKKLGNIGSNIGKVINSPLGAMITSQLGSAIAGQFAFGDKKRYEMTENQRKMQSFANTGVTAISTGAFIGTAALGPGYGTAIGAAAGGLFAFIEATKAAKLSLSEFRDSISENAEKQTSIISDYKDNLEKLTKATESGDKNLIDKATRDLSASLSGLAAKNLTSNIQGKSVEDLDILISDINKKAAMATNVLSATEKIGTGAKEVSFFDKFKQQAGEAIINLTNIVIDTFKFIGNGFVKIGTGIVEMFSSLLTNIKPAWENMMDFLGSSISMLGLKIQAFYNDVLSGIGFNRDAEIEQTKSAIDIYAQIYKESANKISDSIKKALGSASELAINFDIGEFSSKFLQGYGEFFGVTGQRKIQQYNMEDIIANYVKEGGAGTSAFYKRIFNLGEKGKKGQLMDEQLYNVINEIAVSQASKDRAAAIENLRSMLVDRGVSGEDIDVLIYQIEKFSEKSNYKGQFILSEFKNFISSLMSVDATSKEMATTQVNAIKNFTKIRNDIDTSIRDYVQRSEMNQIAINGAIERQKVLLSERSRIAEVFGRPFESINIKQQERILDINRSYQSDLAKSSEKTTQLLDTLSKQSTYQSLESIQQLQQAFVSEDYTPEQRLQLIQQSLQATTVDKEGKAQNLINFQNASDRQKFLDLLKAEFDSLDKRKAQNAEDIKTAKLIYDEEVKRAQEARDFNFQLRAGVLSLSDEADLLLGQLGRKIPSAFADGMTNALMQVAKGTQSIGDAFKDMAINFGQMLMQEVMRAAIGKVLGNVLTPMFSQTGGIVGKQRGGIIRAENGAYIPGNRTGDRNLALLEDGEYVLNREAVAAIGVNNLDSLNYGMAPRFQSGGGFNMQAEQKLIDDKFEYTGNLLQDRRAAQAINSGDYSAYAYSNDPYFTEMKQKAYEDFKRREMEDYQRKVKRAQMIGAIVGAVGSIALAAGMSGLATQGAKAASGLANTAKDGSLVGTNEIGTKAIESLKANKISELQFKNIVSANRDAFAMAGGPSLGQMGLGNSFFGLGNRISNSSLARTFGQFSTPSNASIYKSLMTQTVQGGSQFVQQRRQTGGLVGYQSGGFIPYGARLTDTLPRYMSGGTVMNNPNIRRYAVGGANGMFSSGTSSNNMSTYNNSQNNATNIYITSNNEGMNVNSQTSSYKPNDIKLTKEMALQISKIAKATYMDGMRTNGELSRKQTT